jgi:hypothetical protein
MDPSRLVETVPREVNNNKLLSSQAIVATACCFATRMVNWNAELVKLVFGTGKHAWFRASL